MAARRENHAGTKPRLRKDGRYQVNIMLGGAARSVYGPTPKQAREKARKLADEYARGQLLETPDATLAEFLNHWLETSVRRKREGTHRLYEATIRVHVLPYLGKIPIGKLKRSDIEAWVSDRMASGLAPRTVWRLHAILRAGLNTAVKRDPPILIRNPASSVETVNIDDLDDEVRPLSGAEARRVLAATDGTVGHAFYAVALALGLREGELLGLRWANGVNDPGLDLERGVVRVYRQLQRGHLVQLKRSWHRRILPLSPWLTAVLERHADLLRDERRKAGGRWKEHELVFPTSVGTPHRAANVWRSWQRLQMQIGLSEMLAAHLQQRPYSRKRSRGPHQLVARHTIHDLRHTFASLALEAGVPLWKVSRMLGHKDISITQRIYGHLTPEGREDFSERMEGVLAPRPKTRVNTRVAILTEKPRGADFEFEMTPLEVPGG